jgi:hypothetical protein
MLTLADDIADQQFDYIICGETLGRSTRSRTNLMLSLGGGTAGLTVAARLTEDPNVNVLVLGEPRGVSCSESYTVTDFVNSQRLAR